MGSAFTSLAQDGKISEEELIKLNSAAAEKRKGVPQRQKIVTTGYGADDHSEKLYEYGVNHTFHFIGTGKSGGFETKTETIRIDTILYNRQPDGTWIKRDPQEVVRGLGNGSGNGTGSGISSGEIKTSNEYLFLGTEKIDKQKVKHYRSIKKTTFLSATPVRTRIGINDYW
ncbi:MAG: hypothetical protein ABIO36_02915, partial [Pyrinomonadaceae bacterium]